MNLRVSLALMACLAACGSDPVVEPAGSAKYFLGNHTSRSLRVEAVLSPELGGARTTLATVVPGAVSELFTDGAIGQNPRPEDTFASMFFFRSDTSAQVFAQDPVVNGAWVAERQDSETYGRTHFSLKLQDSDLNE
jgi:hypothetical protein